ncbi:hypothetical protein TB2_011939 [Malus domestica]
MTIDPNHTTIMAATATSSTMGQENDTQFNLVGFSNFVRTNLRSDRFKLSRTYPSVIKPTFPTSSAPATSIHIFDHSASRTFSATQGLSVRAVAIQVEDTISAFTASVAHGTKPSAAPNLVNNRVTIAEVQLYGDVILRYVSYTNHNHFTDPDLHLWFLPGFESLTSSFPIDFEIRHLDHAIGNVKDLKSIVSYVKGFTGFHELAEFTVEDVETSESGLNSVVLVNNEEMVLFPMNEHVYGTKRKSQIQTYLKHNEGAEVQHLALVSDDIFRMLREMQSRSDVGRFQFMPAPPSTYYRNLKKRVGDVLTNEQIKECEELGILVDRDDQETLLQIFTKRVEDRHLPRSV